MPRLVLVLSSLLTAGCAGASTPSHPAAASATASAAEPPADGAGGARLYRSKCGSCHRVWEPSSRTQEEWRKVLERMAPRAHLDGAQRQMLARYLSAHASDAAPGR